MFEMNTLFFQYFPSEIATFQQYSYKISQYARNIKYEIIFVAHSLLDLAIVQQYLYKI